MQSHLYSVKIKRNDIIAKQRLSPMSHRSIMVGGRWSRNHTFRKYWISLWLNRRSIIIGANEILVCWLLSFTGIIGWNRQLILCLENSENSHNIKVLWHNPWIRTIMYKYKDSYHSISIQNVKCKKNPFHYLAYGYGIFGHYQCNCQIYT